MDAARRNLCSFARPIDDFWHLLQNDATLSEKLNERRALPNGKKYYLYQGLIRANLHSFWKMLSTDLIAVLSPAFFLRCIGYGEHDAAYYLRKEYFHLLSVGDIKKMNVPILCPNLATRVYFFPCWTGLGGTPPNTGQGSGMGEGVNAEMHRYLRSLGLTTSLESFFPGMQAVYNNTEY